MTSNPKLKRMILITLGIALALSPVFSNTLYFIAGNGDKKSEYSDNINLDNENLKISKISGKIHIIGNSGWSAAKTAGNCTGNGTYLVPYVIEDLVIDGGGSGSCIWIENSNVYFKIENCTAYNSGGDPNAGIRLLNVTNSQLIDNDCSSNYRGIYLEDSDFNTVSGNTANDNHYGIYLKYSDNNDISGNTVSKNSCGMRLEISANNTVSGNTANDNWYGIYLSYSDFSIVSGNTANNKWYGICLLVSNNNTISGNTANNNDGGINLWTNCNNNNISGNTANYNLYGIYLDGSNYNTVSGNTLMGNDECIVEEDCKGNEFKDNKYCDYGEGDGDGEKILVYILFSLIGPLAVVAILMRKKLKKIKF